MQPIHTNSKGMSYFLKYFLCYLLWAITGGLGFLDLISARDLLLVILAVSPVNRWAVGAIDKFALIGFGIGLLILVLVTESYYRTGVLKGKLWRRFSIVAAFQLYFLSLDHLIVPLLVRRTDLGLRDFFIVGGEVALGTMFLLFARRSRKQDSRSSVLKTAEKS